jgi:uncharacterized membrane protein YidH (DUF202 family)
MAPPERSRRSSAASAQRTAVVITVAAVVMVNLVVAYTLARAAGMRGIELPTAAVWLVTLAGVATTGAAVILWRRYLRQRRPPRGVP